MRLRLIHPTPSITTVLVGRISEAHPAFSAKPNSPGNPAVDAPAAYPPYAEHHHRSRRPDKRQRIRRLPPSPTPRETLRWMRLRLIHPTKATPAAGTPVGRISEAHPAFSAKPNSPGNPAVDAPSAYPPYKSDTRGRYARRPD